MNQMNYYGLFLELSSLSPVSFVLQKIRRVAIGHLSAAVVKQHDEALPSQAK